MDNKDIKLRLFADDLSSFVRNNYSLTKFLDVVERFGKYSGLKVNEEKTETSLLVNVLKQFIGKAKRSNIQLKKLPYTMNNESYIYLT